METADHRLPGQLIETLLEQRGWTKRTLAIVLGENESGLNKILSGRQPVDAKLALGLAEVFGVDAEEFLRLQASYDLAKARIVERPDPKRAARAHLFGGLPVADMIRRGWLDAEKVTDVPKVEAELARFFMVSDPSEIEILPHAAKKTAVAEGVTPSQLAWLYRVKRIASEMLVPRYSPSGASQMLTKLQGLLLSAEEARKVPRILAESGIRFLLVECLPGAKIDGVCLWLDDRSPVIAMTLRYDRIDNFWFVLRHEIEHVINGDGRDSVMLDAELEGDRAGSGDNVPEQERIANRAASEFCVPQKRLNRFRDHQVKIRSIVAPSAVVDGWGDIAPLEQ